MLNWADLPSIEGEETYVIEYDAVGPDPPAPAQVVHEDHPVIWSMFEIVVPLDVVVLLVEVEVEDVTFT